MFLKPFTLFGKTFARSDVVRGNKDCKTFATPWRNIGSITSYVMRGILCVTLNGQILGGWVVILDITRWG